MCGVTFWRMRSTGSVNFMLMRCAWTLCTPSRIFRPFPSFRTLCFFIAPLAAAVPAHATAPVRVLLGVAMFQMVAQIDFSAIEDALPAFVTLVLIPLTFSITQGILCGFILQALLYACVGRAREVPVALWLLAALSAVL